MYGWIMDMEYLYCNTPVRRCQDAEKQDKAQCMLQNLKIPLDKIILPFYNDIVVKERGSVLCLIWCRLRAAEGDKYV